MNESLNQNLKLIITIVKKGNASRIVKASKKAGAEGCTIMMGKGTGVHEIGKLFGIPIEPEKEIIFTFVMRSLIDPVLDAIVAAGKLNKPGTGIAFTVPLNQIAGICHYAYPSFQSDTIGSQNDGCKESTMNQNQIQFNLIITIVDKGRENIVVDATKKAGAEGGTIVFGRGTGVHEHAKLFSIQIEPEKSIVLTLTVKENTERVLRAIEEEACINKPGKGIAMVLPVERTAGINHELKQQFKAELKRINEEEG